MESYEPPEPLVLEDDDLLDGWFVHSRKKREKEQKEREKDDKKNKGPKGNVHAPRKGHARTDGNSEEFILVDKDNGWGQQEIEDMNSLYASKIKDDRQKMIKNSKNKKIEYQELPDIQRQGQLAAAKNAGSQRR